MSQNVVIIALSEGKTPRFIACSELCQDIPQKLIDIATSELLDNNCVIIQESQPLMSDAYIVKSTPPQVEVYKINEINTGWVRNYIEYEQKLVTTYIYAEGDLGYDAFRCRIVNTCLQLSNAQNELSELKAKLSEHAENAQHSQALYEKSQQELTKSRHEITSLMNSNDILRNRVTCAILEYSNTMNENDSLRRAATDLQASCAEAIADADFLRNELAELRGSSQEIDTHVARLTHTVLDLQCENSMLDEKFQSATQKLAELTIVSIAQTNEINNLKHDLEEAEAIIKQTDSSLKEQIAKNKQQQITLSRLQSERAQVTSEISDVRHEIKSLRESVEASSKTASFDDCLVELASFNKKNLLNKNQRDQKISKRGQSRRK